MPEFRFIYEVRNRGKNGRKQRAFHVATFAASTVFEAQRRAKISGALRFGGKPWRITRCEQVTGNNPLDRS